jgi:hypothetical protein
MESSLLAIELAISAMKRFLPPWTRALAFSPAVRLLAMAIVAALAVADLAPLLGQTPAKRQRVALPGPSDAPRKARSVRAQSPADFRREHFLLHTDLPPR